MKVQASIFLLQTLTLGITDATVTVLTNGKIYTSNRSFVSTIAIDDGTGKISYLGNDPTEITNVSVTHNLNLQVVLPGFHDVHLHVVEAGINGQICSIAAETPVRNLASALGRDCAYGGNGWIMGAGIDIGILLETIDTDVNAPLPIEVLDQAFPNTPIVILDSIGHGAVVNTKALQTVGLFTGTPPPGGKVIRLEDGTHTGIVTENMQQLFRDSAFPPTTANREIAYGSLLDSLDRLRRLGITTVSDAGGYWRQAQTQSWERALSEGKLTVKASNALYIYPDTPLSEQLDVLTSRYSNDKTSRLRFNQAKIYVDGILELGTGALYAPYLPALGLPPGEQLGFEYFGSSANLKNVAATLANIGYQLHFHTVGDRAAGIALDAIEALPANGDRSVMHRLTHCYLIDQRDRDRFASLGVVADFQMSPSSLAIDYTQFLSQDIIGATRTAQLQPAKAIHDANGLVTLSSDWDADELSPLVKLEIGMGIFNNIHTVIDMMTIHGAELLQQKDRTGSIAVGKDADLVVLDKDIFSIPTSDISTAQVTLTILEGDVVFNATVDGGGSGGGGGGENPSGEGPSGILGILAFLLSLFTCGLLQ
jgi:predicted amidohydrolase YtcJ